MELAGNALFNPYMLNYAPKEKRFRQIAKRLEKMPALFEQAKSELVDSPEIWNRVAQEENDGNIELIDKTLRAEVPDAQKADYNRAAGPMRSPRCVASTRYLKDTLSKKTSDWRLGKDNYAKKFQFMLHTGKAPEQLLAEAEAELKIGARGDGQALRAQDGEAGSGRDRETTRDAGHLPGCGSQDAGTGHRRSCAKRDW